MIILYDKENIHFCVCDRNLKPKEVVYAMRTLGVIMSVDQCVSYIEKESRDNL